MLTLEEVAKRCEPVFEARPIQRAWVFGSYARGEQDEESDVDICYDLVEGACTLAGDGDGWAGFHALAEVHQALEGALGLEVDVCRRPRPEGTRAHRLFYDEVERDRRLIYERAAV